MLTDEYTAWVEINRSAIANNVGLLRKITGRPVMAVVKANAYGHGLIESTKAAVKGGASWCGVARVEEGLALRRKGVDIPILILGYTSPSCVIDAARNDITLTLFDPDTAKAYSAALSSAQITARIHIKVDIGMGRLGVFPSEAIEFTRFVHSLPGFVVDGIYTHFPCADDPALRYTADQIAAFETLLRALQAAGLRPQWVHAANSAAALFYPAGRLDMVRGGVSIYGLHPSSKAPLPAGFQPALALKSKIVSIKNFPTGHGIGYNYRYITSHPERIGVCAMGYADGIRWRLGNYALVGGRRVRVVGSMCMDQCMLQLDGVLDANLGSEVVWIGRQGDEQITAEEIAQNWGTINYEVATGLSSRLPRLYID